MRRVLAVLVVFMFAGCLGVGQAEDAAGRVSRATSGDGGNATAWSAIEFSLDMPAGSWFVFAQRFPGPVQRVVFQAEVEIQLRDAPADAVLFVVPPALFSDGDDPFSPFDSPRFYWDRALGPQGYSGSSNRIQTTGFGAFQGFWGAAAATHPWTARVLITLGEGAGRVVTEPEVFLTGQDALVAVQPMKVEGQSVPGVAQLALSEEVVGPGWTHLQLAFDPFQPTGVRSHAFGVPGGPTVEGIGASAGFYGPYPAGASYSRVDYVGAFNATAGTARAEVTLVEVDTAVALGLVHLPIPAGAWPSWVQSKEYVGSV